MGPDHWGPSPDFPCGAATASCEMATLPDLRDPLRGPGAVEPVSRISDKHELRANCQLRQAKTVTSFRAFLFCFANGLCAAAGSGLWLCSVGTLDSSQMEKAKITSKRTAGSKPAAWKRLFQTLVSLALVVGIFVGVMPQIADYSDVWATIRSLTWLETTTLTLVAVWNLATYWFVLVAALPGLRLREAAIVNQSSTAVSNSLPGGGAIGVGVTLAMLTSWGFRFPDIARSALVTGIRNNFVK